MRELRQRFLSHNVTADVTWRAGEGQSQWRGRLVRAAASFDESTRSIPLIIEVDDAYTAVEVGVKPALVPGMFVEVILYGDVVDDVFVVPRDVVRDGSVYVVRDGKLDIVPVHVLALEEEAAVIDTGLQAGDQIVMADLFPAARGMLLRSAEVENPITPRKELPSLNSGKAVAQQAEATP